MTTNALLSYLLDGLSSMYSNREIDYRKYVELVEATKKAWHYVPEVDIEKL